MKLHISLFAALFVFVVTRSTDAQVGRSKENLDLPYDAVGEDEEEEDAPETIEFYGQNFEGDGYFYTIDRSTSMRDSGELQVAKREVIRNISEFSSHVEFAVVFFDENVEKYPETGQPMKADAGKKQAAIGWVQTVPGGKGSCSQQGIVAALEFANKSSARRKTVIYVGDGGGTCKGADEGTYLDQTIGIVTARNYQRASINCIGVVDVKGPNRRFMQNLARSNNGTYTEIKNSAAR